MSNLLDQIKTRFGSAGRTAIGLVGGLAVIIGGIVASAIWDGIKIAARWIWSASTTVATLGISSLIDSVYANSAIRGITNNTFFLSLLLMIFSFISCIPSLVYSSAMILLRIKSREINGTLSADAIEKLIKKVNRYTIIFLSIGSAAFIFSLSQTVQIQYAAIAGYELDRLRVMAEEFHSPQESARIRSEIANIRSRADYIRIFDKLKNTLDRNNISYVRFKPL